MGKLASSEPSRTTGKPERSARAPASSGCGGSETAAAGERGATPARSKPAPGAETRSGADPGFRAAPPPTPADNGAALAKAGAPGRADAGASAPESRRSPKPDGQTGANPEPASAPKPERGPELKSSRLSPPRPPSLPRAMRPAAPSPEASIKRAKPKGVSPRALAGLETGAGAPESPGSPAKPKACAGPSAGPKREKPDARGEPIPERRSRANGDGASPFAAAGFAEETGLAAAKEGAGEESGRNAEDAVEFWAPPSGPSPRRSGRIKPETPDGRDSASDPSLRKTPGAGLPDCAAASRSDADPGALEGGASGIREDREEKGTGSSPDRCAPCDSPEGVRAGFEPSWIAWPRCAENGGFCPIAAGDGPIADCVEAGPAAAPGPRPGRRCAGPSRTEAKSAPSLADERPNPAQSAGSSSKRSGLSLRLLL